MFACLLIMFARGGWEGCDARGWKLLAKPVAEAKEATTRFGCYVSGNIVILPEGDFGEKCDTQIARYDEKTSSVFVK